VRPPSSNPGLYSQRGPKWAELEHPKEVGLSLANFARLEFSVLSRNCSSWPPVPHDPLSLYSVLHVPLVFKLSTIVHTKFKYYY
jgi:hypothetical protein